MSTSSDQQPGSPRQPSTQEIPVVDPAPARPATGGAHLPPPGAATPAPVQPTGPVDFVPGLPGAGVLPPPPPAAAPPPPPPAGAESAADAPGTTRTPPAPEAAASEPAGWPQSLEPGTMRAARRVHGDRAGNRQALIGLGLAVLSVVLLEVGLLLGFGELSLWSTVTLWSAFATACGVLALVAFAAFYPAGNHLRSAAMWRIAAAGLVGLSVFWVLVVLPFVASDRGFVLTAALGCLGAALWIGPRRKD